MTIRTFFSFKKFGLAGLVVIIAALSACHRGKSSRKQMHQPSQHRGEMMNKMNSNEQGSVNSPSDTPSGLPDGKKLYTQFCSSCHGSGGTGMAGAFPPLVNARWITMNKSVPVRILLHGMQGKIRVQGDSYGGSMASFADRLSDAEIASILNYLRRESDGEFPTITKEDVNEIKSNYPDRNAPWTAVELLSEK